MEFIKKMRALLLLVATPLVCAAEVPAGWQMPDATQRVVVAAAAVSSRRTCVSIPSGYKKTTVLTSTGTELRSRVFPGAGDRSAVLIDTTMANGETLNVYLGVGGTDATVIDGRSVAVEFSRAVGQDRAQSWPAFRHMLARRGRILGRTGVQSFRSRAEIPKRQGRQVWSRNGFLVELRSFVYVSETREVVLGVEGSDSVFLLLNGEYVAGQVGEDDRGEWSTSRPVLLQQGLHELVVFNICRHRPRVRVGWGESDQAMRLISETDHVTARTPLRGRLENLESPVHAFAVVKSGKLFQFGEDGTPMRRLELRNQSVCRPTQALSAVWQLDGKDCAAGDEAEVVVRADQEHILELKVSTARGEVSRDRISLAATYELPEIFDVSGRITGVPAVCYQDDRMLPQLEVRANSPSDLEFDLSATVEFRDGRRTERRDRTGVRRTWAAMPLQSVKAGTVKRIEWIISHAGAQLASGELYFADEPFDRMPAGITGDTLVDKNGSSLILVMNPYVSLPAPTRAYRGIYPAAVFDASIATPVHFDGKQSGRVDGRLAELLNRPADDFLHVDASWLTDSGTCHQSLGRLVELTLEFADYPGAVVLCLGGEAILNRQPCGVFERELSAFCELLAGAGNADVVLVTPPPYTGQEDEARKLAEATQRVADARGLKVADVYSAFRAMGDGAGLVEGMQVTVQGQTVAAQVIARTLKRAGRGDSDD